MQLPSSGGQVYHGKAYQETPRWDLRIPSNCRSVGDGRVVSSTNIHYKEETNNMAGGEDKTDFGAVQEFVDFIDFGRKIHMVGRFFIVKTG